MGSSRKFEYNGPPAASTPRFVFAYSMVQRSDGRVPALEWLGFERRQFAIQAHERRDSLLASDLESCVDAAMTTIALVVDALDAAGKSIRVSDPIRDAFAFKFVRIRQPLPTSQHPAP